MEGYILSVAAVSVICALAEALIPDESGLKKAVSLAVGAVLIVTLLTPLKDLGETLSNLTLPKTEDTDRSNEYISEDYRKAVALRLAEYAAGLTEEKCSVPRRCIKVNVHMPDKGDVPNKIEVILSGDGLWAASAPLEEYLKDKLDVECEVVKANE